jgi:surface polysaccharide O-acyltransferase-like enzyme
MSSQGAPPGAVERHLGLDWLRIGAFALLIPYHIGMYFVPGTWVVKTAHPVEWVAWLLDALQPWRLPLLFLVSGYASRALLAKLGGAGAFLRSRSRRLLLPLAFGTAVLVAPQGWVRVAEAGYSQSYWHFWLHDWLRFSDYRGIGLPSSEHLWFVTYLWVYTALLCAAIGWLPASWKDKLERGFDSLGTGRRALFAPILLMVFLRLSLLFVVPESGTVLTNWHGHIVYVPPFLFGFALAGRPSFWPAVMRCWRPALGVSLACYLGILWAELTYPGDVVLPHLAQALARSAAVAMGWSTSLLLLAAAHRWLRRDHRFRRTLSEAVFPFYIIHQTIIVTVGWQLRPLGYSNAAEFAIILASTAGGCWLFHEAGRRVGWLRPLIGLSTIEGRARSAEPLPAAA